jgi:hypothetical protein
MRVTLILNFMGHYKTFFFHFNVCFISFMDKITYNNGLIININVGQFVDFVITSCSINQDSMDVITSLLNIRF